MCINSDHPAVCNGTVFNPTYPIDVADVGCVVISGNFLLGILCGLFGLGYTAYTLYIFFLFTKKVGYINSPPHRGYTQPAPHLAQKTVK